jgi:hypothetical protein
MIVLNDRQRRRMIDSESNNRSIERDSSGWHGNSQGSTRRLQLFPPVNGWTPESNAAVVGPGISCFPAPSETFRGSVSSLSTQYCSRIIRRQVGSHPSFCYVSDWRTLDTAFQTLQQLKKCVRVIVLLIVLTWVYNFSFVSHKIYMENTALKHITHNSAVSKLIKCPTFIFMHKELLSSSVLIHTVKQLQVG